MPRFGWMRLAYLLFVLTILVSLARVADPDAEARSLISRAPDAPQPPQETPQATSLTEDVISSLEDIRGSTGRPGVGPSIAEPRLPVAPVPEEAGPRRAAGEQEPAEEGLTASATEAPIFYRPADPGAAPDTGPATGPVCGDLSGVPEDGRIVFPLEKRFYYSYEDSWGAPRTQGGHEGTDLMTPSGVPEYAVTDGTVVPVAGSDTDGWNSLGGYAVMIRADYSIGPVEEGDLFYYAHLERESALPIGARVQAGQVVGYAGDTGQGPPGTRGLFPPHLHLGWYDGTGNREEAASGAMNPYPLLEWIKANGGAVTGGSDARYCEAPRPGPPTPSGAGDWPTPPSPGLSPDLDTGSDDPKPTPDRRDARKESQKRDPAVERRARKQDKPAEKPARPNRPEERPQRAPDSDLEKPRNTNRPEAAEPPKPIRPAPDPAKPEQQPPEQVKPVQPAPGQSNPKPPGDPEKPSPDPSGSQYDPATGAASGPPVARDEARTEDTPPEKATHPAEPTPQQDAPRSPTIAES